MIRGFPGRFLAGLLLAAGASGAAAQISNDLIAKAKAEGRITWYTADTVLAVEALARAFQSKYGIRVEANRKTTLPLVQQFTAESSRGQSPADVITVLGFGPITGSLAKGNLLQPYVPAGAARLPKSYRVGDVAFAYSVAGTGVMYNTSLVSAEDARLLRTPDGWMNPRFTGKIAFTAPLGGTTGGNMLMMHQRLGIDFLEKLVKQQKVVVYQTVAAVADAVAGGEQAIGLNVTPSVVSRAAQGAPIRYLSTDQWTYVVPAVTAISAKARNGNAARLFAEWLLTPEAQVVHSDVSYWTPTLPGVKPNYPKAEWLEQPKNPVTEDDPIAFEADMNSKVASWRKILGW